MEQPNFDDIRNGLQKILSKIDKAEAEHGKHPKLDALRTDAQKNLADVDENERTWQALEKSIDAERDKVRNCMELAARREVDSLLDICDAAGADKKLATSLVLTGISNRMPIDSFKELVKSEVSIKLGSTPTSTPTSQRIEDGIASTSDDIETLKAQLKDTSDPVEKKQIASKISKLRDVR